MWIGFFLGVGSGSIKLKKKKNFKWFILDTIIFYWSSQYIIIIMFYRNMNVFFHFKSQETSSKALTISNNHTTKAGLSPPPWYNFQTTIIFRNNQILNLHVSDEPSLPDHGYLCCQLGARNREPIRHRGPQNTKWSEYSLEIRTIDTLIRNTEKLELLMVNLNTQNISPMKIATIWSLGLPIERCPGRIRSSTSKMVIALLIKNPSLPS